VLQKASMMQAHSKSGTDMSARETYSEPRPVEAIVVKANKSAIGKAFSKKAKAVQQALDNLADCEEDALRIKVCFFFHLFFFCEEDALYIKVCFGFFDILQLGGEIIGEKKS
jgi:glycyl-tRNA synthetase (class II)